MAVGNTSSIKRHQQIVKMMVVVLGFFIVLAGPWHIADLILDTGGENGGPMHAMTQLIVREVVSLLMFVNGWAMPIIYTSFNSGVRKIIAEMLTCGSARCWSSNRVEAENTVNDAGFGAGQPPPGNAQMSTVPA